MINEPHVVHTHEHEHCPTVKLSFVRISWTAIFVGVFVSFGICALLNLFFTAIGLTTFVTTEVSGTSLVLGGILAVFIGTIVASLVSGFVAGYLGRLYCSNHNLGILYGFTCWSLALFFMMLFVMPAQQFFASYARGIIGPSPVITQQVSNSSDNTPLAVVKHHKKDANNDTTPITDKSVVVNVTPEHAAYGAFVVFLLFFVGAFSSCVGACWAMSCCHKEENEIQS